MDNKITEIRNALKELNQPAPLWFSITLGVSGIAILSTCAAIILLQ